MRLAVPIPRIPPVVLESRKEPFSVPDWLFELKWDEFRAMAYVEAGSVRLVSRAGNDYMSFDSLRAGLAALPV